MQITAHATTNNGSVVQKRPFYRHLWVATLSGLAFIDGSGFGLTVEEDAHVY